LIGIDLNLIMSISVAFAVCPIVYWFYFRKFLYLLNIINVSLYFLFNFFCCTCIPYLGHTFLYVFLRTRQ